MIVGCLTHISILKKAIVQFGFFGVVSLNMFYVKNVAEVVDGMLIF